MRSDAVERVHRALEEIAAGKMVVLVDDEGRENEGDLVMAADLATPEAINFMARFGRGLICLSLEHEKVRALGLPMMVDQNQTKAGTAFTISIEAREGVTTGISAADRAQTIRVAVAKNTTSADLVSPGHIFPLRAVDGGVLQRTGHTEGSVDLARMAGRTAAGVICEIMNDDGTMARMGDLEKFVAEHQLRLLSIADLIQYRLQTERLVRQVTEREIHLPPSQRAWRARVYESLGPNASREVLALTLGKIDASPTLVRVQMGSVLGDVFSANHETRIPANEAMRRIEEEGRGVVLFLPPRYSLAQDLEYFADGEKRRREPLAPHEVVLREIGFGSQVLKDLGVRKMRVLTNRPSRIAAVDGFDLEVVEQVLLNTPDELAEGGELPVTH
ncbi:MAG TPA: 3,4-dihydroxy-2-butanone-4-phosphate synthase [Polyangiales bacterium]|jgi:3,4-dihydroxy 2-butanone 4-phosphate synthase/GTP cyclohydrolase II|nr:3,4-dihydroxy-2-butanone-4-phosphate synthase [Polyangiales bacterium]